MTMSAQTIRVATPISKGHQARAFQGDEELPIMFLAPIDLQTEDHCTVIVEDGTLLAIERDKKVIWTNWDNGVGRKLKNIK